MTTLYADIHTRTPNDAERLSAYLKQRGEESIHKVYSSGNKVHIELISRPGPGGYSSPVDDLDILLNLRIVKQYGIFNR